MNTPSIPFDALDAAGIRAALPHWARDRLRRLDVHAELASTNDALLAVDDLPAGRFDACLAEFQSAGRGRRGRLWQAPPGAGLCLSVNWIWREKPAALPALSLAAGVAVLRALAASGVRGPALKWPNDIVHAGAKLGGILAELRGDTSDPACVIVGVGLNVRLPDATMAALRAAGQEATYLARITAHPPARNALAAALINELVLALEEFGLRGMAAFADEWRAADALRHRPVRVLQGEQSLDGLACGIDADGALLVDVDGARRRVLSGEVSVRALA